MFMRILIVLLALVAVAADGPGTIKTTDAEKAKLAPFLARQKSYQAQIDQINQQLAGLRQAYDQAQRELDAAIGDIQKAHECDKCLFTQELDLQKPPDPPPAPAPAANK